MNIIVDKLSSFDRFVVPYEKSAYYLYNKSTIEIPDKLGIYLLNTLKRAGYSTSVFNDMGYLQACIYISFNTLRRHFRNNPDLTVFNDNHYHNTEFELSVYKCIEEFFKIDNFEYLYSNPQLKWIEVCKFIQESIKNYYLHSRVYYENAW